MAKANETLSNFLGAFYGSAPAQMTLQQSAAAPIPYVNGGGATGNKDASRLQPQGDLSIAPIATGDKNNTKFWDDFYKAVLPVAGGNDPIGPGLSDPQSGTVGGWNQFSDFAASGTPTQVHPSWWDRMGIRARTDAVTPPIDITVPLGETPKAKPGPVTKYVRKLTAPKPAPKPAAPAKPKNATTFAPGSPGASFEKDHGTGSATQSMLNSSRWQTGY